jgi:hypothetical protein
MRSGDGLSRRVLVIYVQFLPKEKAVMGANAYSSVRKQGQDASTEMKQIEG